MANEVQMPVKMGPGLNDRFMAAEADRHSPAAQIVGDLMRLYIAASETPNALTAETFARAAGKTCFTLPVRPACFAKTRLRTRTRLRSRAETVSQG